MSVPPDPARSPVAAENSFNSNSIALERVWRIPSSRATTRTARGGTFGFVRGSAPSPAMSDVFVDAYANVALAASVKVETIIWNLFHGKLQVY